MKKVFVTGANGFVGKALIKELAKKNYSYIAGTREIYGDLAQQNNWKGLLSDSDIVVHLAARVHVMDEQETNPLAAFRKANVEGTLSIARAAKEAGVRRFIFISSVKVNGEHTKDLPFSEESKPCSCDPYGISKLEAENELLKLHSPGMFEIVIIRPPLIYGPGVKANFEKLAWLVQKDLPIPFGKVENKRSLVSVLNLCDLIITCFLHPNASGEIFLVSDGQDYSLRQIIELLGKTMKKHPHLIPVPVSIMKFAFLCLGKKDYSNRLFGNLHVSIQKAKNLLGWIPPYGFVETYKN